MIKKDGVMTCVPYWVTLEQRMY